MEKYKYIVNPLTGRKVKVNGRIGQRVIKVYLNQLGGRNRRTGAAGGAGAGAAPTPDDDISRYIMSKLNKKIKIRALRAKHMPRSEIRVLDPDVEPSGKVKRTNIFYGVTLDSNFGKTLQRYASGRYHIINENGIDYIIPISPPTPAPTPADMHWYDVSRRSYPAPRGVARSRRAAPAPVAKRRKKRRAGLVLIFPHGTNLRGLDLHIEDRDEFIKRRAGIVGYVFPTVNEIMEMIIGKKTKFPRRTPFILAGNFGEYLSEDKIKLIRDNVKENPVIKKSFVPLPDLIPDNLFHILTQSLITSQINSDDRIACICYATLPSKKDGKKVIFDAQLGLTGHMEAYDRGDPMNTIIRELKEEMGLDNSFEVIGRRGNSFVATINFS
jgi:hypothetical protein